jgi:hypothetical protein
MKLREVVIQGKCCGLETVEECITNFYINGINMFPYNALEYETKELREDIRKYEAGELELPWDYIDEEVDKFNQEYLNWLIETDRVDNDYDDMVDLEWRLERLK